MNKRCIVCGRYMDIDKIEEHHISYSVDDFPEITVKVHKRCHNIIHHTDYYPGLKPRKGQSNKHYNNDENKKDDKIEEEPKSILEEIRDVIRNCKESPTSKETIFKKMEKKGYKRSEVRPEINKMRTKGQLYTPNQGEYRLA